MKLSSLLARRARPLGPCGPGLRLAFCLLGGLGALGSEAPTMTITPSVLLSWPDPGVETQVVVASSSMTPDPKVWQPLLEPVFPRLGALGCAVPVTGQQQFFRLEPGFQVMDDCGGAAGSWEFWAYPTNNGGVTLRHTNGALRVQAAAGKKETLFLWPAGAPGIPADVAVGQPHRDFACSIDLVAWPDVGRANVWIQGRGTWDPYAIVAADIHFEGGAATELTVGVQTATVDRFESVPCSMTRGKVYRLTLHGIGDRHTAGLREAGTPDKLVATVSMTSTLIPSGTGVSAGIYTFYRALDVTLDNFLFSGVRP